MNIFPLVSTIIFAINCSVASAQLAGQYIKDCADCPEMVALPAGSFVMGSPPDPRPDPFSNAAPKTSPRWEKPQRRVQIASFAIGKYEVTQEQWYAVMGVNPSSNKGRTLPVEQVSWNDIQVFIQKLNQKTGKTYRLPSEAEWEYAARAGSQAEYLFSDDEKELGRYAWYRANSGLQTHPVGEKQANLFGLHDMYGNVWEWVQDCWHEDYTGAPADGSAWTTGCSSSGRVLRGGSWSYVPAYLRSAVRNRYSPDSRSSDVGLRLARTLLTATLPLNAGPSASYAERVRAKFKPNIQLSAEAVAQISGNPVAEVEVKAGFDGSITERKLIKSSGVKAWDDAVLRAIDKTETLPRDVDGRVPSLLVLSFRPRE